MYWLYWWLPVLWWVCFRLTALAEFWDENISIRASWWPRTCRYMRPMQENSFSGYCYFVNFKDDYSKFRNIYFLKQKSKFANKLKVILAEAKTLGHTVNQLLSDRGGKFDNREVRFISDNVGLHYRILYNALFTRAKWCCRKRQSLAGRGSSFYATI